MVRVTTLRRNFQAVFDELARDKVPNPLTRGSRPEAVPIPYDGYPRFQQLREREVLERLDHLLAKIAEMNAQWNEEEVARDLGEVRM